MTDQIKAGVYGASGYTAGELLRILLAHPRVRVTRIVSHSHSGKLLRELHPHLEPSMTKTGDLVLSSTDTPDWSDCDCVFFATPAGIAMRAAAGLPERNIKVIDLSPDFRIKNPTLWETWYSMRHESKDLLKEAAYGLPEAGRKEIARARIVANPGCYATAIQLALLPLLASKEYNAVFDGCELVADAKSGTSGAGRKGEVHLSFSEVSEDFTCYAAEGHRHQPEMENHLLGLYGGNWQHPLRLRFVPHLLPIARGIFATVYLPLGKKEKNADKIRNICSEFYAEEPFVRVLPAGMTPRVKSVRGSNECQLAVFAPPQSDYVIVCSVLDNLVKGAAGQAVQNMNILFGLSETTGLRQASLMP